MVRCTKGVFGKYCFVTHESGETMWCLTYTVCDSDRKVTPEDIPKAQSSARKVN